MCVCMRMYVRVTKGRLKACVCLHDSVCICMCKCICVSTYAHTIMVDLKLITSLLIGIRAIIMLIE